MGSESPGSGGSGDPSNAPALGVSRDVEAQLPHRSDAGRSAGHGETGPPDAGVVDAELQQLPAEQRQVVEYIERRLVRIEQIVREEGDPYAGFPAPEVVAAWQRYHPGVDILGHIVERASSEQAHRHHMDEGRLALSRAELEAEKYQAHTDRLEVDGYFRQQAYNRRYAFAALLCMIGAGVGALLLGAPAVAGIVFGASIVGVVGAFLIRRAQEGLDTRGTGGDH